MAPEPEFRSSLLPRDSIAQLRFDLLELWHSTGSSLASLAELLFGGWWSSAILDKFEAVGYLDVIGL